MRSDQYIEKVLTDILCGQVTELRALGVRTDRWKAPHTVSGYYDDYRKMAGDAANLMDDAKAIYFLPNPVNPALLARAFNRSRGLNKGDSTTADHDIFRRNWLLVDTDAKRPAGISASDEEKETALNRAKEVRGYLTELGWPEPVLADSGNGGHLMYRIDLPVEDDGLVQRCLKSLGSKFSDNLVDIDQAVFNPARIWKLYGTKARKGENIPDRPHRIASVLTMPVGLHDNMVDLEQLEQLAATVEPEKKKVTISKPRTSAFTGEFDLEEWIRDAGLVVHGPNPWKGGGQKWVFDVCPWNADHTDRSAFIVQQPSGEIAAGCQHNGCKGEDWHSLRRMLEPEKAPAPKPAQVPPAPSTPSQKPTTVQQFFRPTCVLGGDIEERSKTVLRIAERYNDPPHMFVRGREPIRLVQERGKMVLAAFTGTSLRAVLSERFQFKKKVLINDEWKETITDLPVSLCENILEKSSWPFPEIEDIVQFPVLEPTGELVTTTGYRSEIMSYVNVHEELNLMDNPTEEQVEKAKIMIFDEMLGQFPFVDQPSKAHAMALGLLPFARYAIDGPTPPHLVTATAPRTGKTLLVNMLACVVTGEDSSLLSPTDSEEEWRKRITTLLMGSPAIVCIDNVNKKLNSAALAAMFTSRFWTDRILGGNKQATLRNNAVWSITANNPTVSEELCKRSCWIALDPQMENPEERTGFKHHPIRKWVIKNRTELMRAFLVLIKNWTSKGMPRSKKTLGSFEEWAEVIGGILETANIEGFLGNTRELKERVSSDSQEFKDFITLLWEREHDRQLKVSEIRDFANEVELLAKVLGDKSEKSQDSRLGKALTANRDRVFEITGITVALKKEKDSHTKRNVWRLEPQGDYVGKDDPELFDTEL